MKLQGFDTSRFSPTLIFDILNGITLRLRSIRSKISQKGNIIEVMKFWGPKVLNIRGLYGFDLPIFGVPMFFLLPNIFLPLISQGSDLRNLTFWDSARSPEVWGLDVIACFQYVAFEIHPLKFGLLLRTSSSLLWLSINFDPDGHLWTSTYHWKDLSKH